MLVESEMLESRELNLLTTIVDLGGTHRFTNCRSSRPSCSVALPFDLSWKVHQILNIDFSPFFFFGATVLQSWRCAITDRNVTQSRNNLSLLPSKNFLLLKGEESTNETVSKTKGIEAINFFN